MRWGVILAVLVLVLGWPTAVEAAPHPCDGRDPPTGTARVGAATLSWCASGTEPVTGWAVYVDEHRFDVPVKLVTVGPANRAGRRLYSLSVEAPPGVDLTRPILIRIAAMTARGEGIRSLPFTLTVQPLTPVLVGVRGVQ